jgi:hypothetical protein
MVYAVRQLACDALDASAAPNLLALVQPTLHWIAASVRGAVIVEDWTAVTKDVPWARPRRCGLGSSSAPDVARRRPSRKQ